MNRICIALSGFVSPNIVLKVINVSAAAAVLSWKERKFWMLWNIDLPKTSDRRLISNKHHPHKETRRTLFHGGQDGGKVIVDEDDVSSFFRDVCPAFAHRHANIRHFQRRRIVHCKTNRKKKEHMNKSHREFERLKNTQPPSPVMATTAPRA
jgi:hypothetical protein